MPLRLRCMGILKMRGGRGGDDEAERRRRFGLRMVIYHDWYMVEFHGEKFNLRVLV